MRIPWKKLWDLALTVVRATAPDKSQADPPPQKEPTAEELWDRWKGKGPTVALFVLACSTVAQVGSAQAVDSACVATVAVNADTLARLHLPGAELYPSQRRSRERLMDVATARCVTPKPDTVRVVVTDTVVRVDTLVQHDTVYVAAPVDSLPVDSLPADTSGTPGDTITVPPPPDTTTPPPSSGVAELPRAVPTWPAALATVPCTDTVSGNNWQAAVNAARAGDVLCFSGVYLGTITLPNRSDSGWVVLRSLTSPVAPGARVRPSDAAQLSSIVATGTNSAIVAAPGAHGWYVRELEVSTDPTLSTLTYALIDLATPPSVTQFARDLVFDRVYAHGWPTRPLRRCVALNSAATAIINSWLDDCHEKGADSQAIAGWSGPGPYRIENNHLAGAGENVIFGGADPRFPGVHPSDITMRRNYVYTPMAWKGVWTKKNSFELKNVQRILVEQNVFDGSWADGQTGIAIVIKSANQSGGGSSRDNGSRDVTFRRNLIVNAAGAITVNGRGGDAGNIDSLSRRIEITENYADSIGLAATGHDNRGVLILTGATDVLFRQNTWLSPPNDGSAYTGGSVGTLTAVRLTIDRDVRTRGRYGVMGCWTVACAPDFTAHAALIGAGAAPAGFTVYPTLDAALAAGFGISRATIDAAVRGVVITP